MSSFYNKRVVLSDNALASTVSINYEQDRINNKKLLFVIKYNGLLYSI